MCRGAHAASGRSLFGGVSFGKYASAMAMVGRTCLCQREPTCRSIEEENAQPALEPLHMSANCGFRNLETACRSRKASVLGNAGERGDALKRIHDFDCPENRTRCLSYSG
jgi:hypothetical protein